MTACAHVPPPAPAAAEVAAALQAAERRCASAGERWTPSRRRTFELLLEAGAPVKAYDLIASYARKSEPLAKPPTIYRALDFLTGQGLVHRIDSLNAFLACQADHVGQAAGFLICDCCGRVEEFDAAVGPAALAAATARGFIPQRINVEVRGACAVCR